MAEVHAIRTEFVVLYHCSECALEDLDESFIQAHVSAGCPIEQVNMEWAKGHRWEYGKGWVKI